MASFVVLIGYEIGWRYHRVQQVKPSPSGRYTAQVSSTLFENPSYERGVYLWPRWAPMPSLMATKILDAPCTVTLEWKGDNELYLICPAPEGSPRLEAHPWSVKVILEQPDRPLRQVTHPQSAWPAAE
ncbi:hypothetical protein [Massilia sp. YMA4]|uniref:hypothetical protein n=1 Tax=Massilia sp. YMA4 TaxID=1593482 RepID=UPI0015820EA1|nr:hypothetical protein [Massilia sp. YMA4]